MTHHYVDTTTLELLFEGDIRLKFPNMGTEFVLPQGYAPIEVLPFDAPPENYTMVQDTPFLDNGAWKLSHSFVPMSQQAIDAIRASKEQIEATRREELARPNIDEPGSAPNVIE